MVLLQLCSKPVLSESDPHDLILILLWPFTCLAKLEPNLLFSESFHKMKTTHSKYKRKATQIRTVLINCRGWFSNCLVDSSNSKATSVLWVSEWVSGWGRLKLHPPLIIYEGADTTHITSNRKLYLCISSIQSAPDVLKGPVLFKFYCSENVQNFEEMVKRAHQQTVKKCSSRYATL